MGSLASRKTLEFPVDKLLRQFSWTSNFRENPKFGFQASIIRAVWKISTTDHLGGSFAKRRFGYQNLVSMIFEIYSCPM